MPAEDQTPRIAAIALLLALGCPREIVDDAFTRIEGQLIPDDNDELFGVIDRAISDAKLVARMK